jgi:hypothetical protein
MSELRTWVLGKCLRCENNLSALSAVMHLSALDRPGVRRHISAVGYTLGSLCHIAESGRSILNFGTATEEFISKRHPDADSGN